MSMPGWQNYSTNPDGLMPNDSSSFYSQTSQLSNGSPSPYAPSPFAPHAVTPQKRPHSPPPSLSRSQTPGPQNPQIVYQQQYDPNRGMRGGYQQHLQQHGSATASPSPRMQNQSFGTGPPPPKRIATPTQSPSPFSAQQGFVHQGSPPPQSRVGTPMNMNGSGMGMQQQYAYNQGYGSPAPQPGPGPSPSQNPNQMQQNQFMHQQHQQMMQRQEQQRMVQMQGGMGVPNGPPNSMAMNPQMNPRAMGPGQQMQRPPQQQYPQQMSQTQMEHMKKDQQFRRSLQQFWARFPEGPGKELDARIDGRSVNLFVLFSWVQRCHGSQKVRDDGRWPDIAQQIGFPNDYRRVEAIFDDLLLKYEDFYNKKNIERAQQQQGQRPMGHPGMQGQIPPHMQQRASVSGMSGVPMHMGQTPQRPPPGVNPAMSGQMPMGVMAKPQPGMPPQTPTRQNGYPQRAPGQMPQQGTPRMSMDNTPPHAQIGSPGFPAQPGARAEGAFGLEASVGAAPFKEIPSDFEPRVRTLDTYGGLDIKVMAELGMQLSYYRPSIPGFPELGTIDIHALTMSLKSGLPGEIRVALDTLTTVSVEPRLCIVLDSCYDLVESLIDVAEDQITLLGEHAQDDPDQMAMPAYEEVLRACRKEEKGLREDPPFGSLEYNLERAADILICVTSIIRNLSTFEPNFGPLADQHVVRFFSNVIERIGTTHLLLRTHTNTLDFMKDIIIYLSNLAHSIVLPSEDEALNLLHLILSFAPLPLPHIPGREHLMFTPYTPAHNRYLPPAVDALAKLLARDDPNRNYFKTIFLSENITYPPYDLLTRAFSLSIAPIPNSNTSPLWQHCVEVRRPFLEQGVLAGDILAQICPTQELARSWLTSEDGFGSCLLRLVCLLSPQSDRNGLARLNQGHKLQDIEEAYPFARITHRTMSILRNLADKAEDRDVDGEYLPGGLFPKKENILGALLTQHIDGVIVRELVSYAGLDK